MSKLTFTNDRHIKIPHFCGIVNSGGEYRDVRQTNLALVREVYFAIAIPQIA